MQRQLEEKQIAEQAQLEVQHRQALAEIDRELEAERNATDSRIVEQIEKQKNQMLLAKKKEFQEKVEERRRRDDISKEEYERLLASHRDELSAMERGVEEEKSKQQKALGDKIAERRRKKAERLQNRQEAEMEKEMAKAKEERDALVSKIVRKS